MTESRRVPGRGRCSCGRPACRECTGRRSPGSSVMHPVACYRVSRWSRHAALIEKVRTVVTDGQDSTASSICDRGRYSVTFTLPVLRQSGVRASSCRFTDGDDQRRQCASAASRRRSTVTGATPVRRAGVTPERVLGKEMVDALPTGRTATKSRAHSRINLRPLFGRRQDVGGTTGDVMQALTSRQKGKTTSDARRHEPRLRDRRWSRLGFSPNMAASRRSRSTPRGGAEQVKWGSR